MDSRLIWLAVAAFVGSTEGGMVNGLLPAIGADMAVSAGQTGQVVLGYSLAYAIGTPLLSVLLGGVGRRRILSGAQAVLAVGALLMAVSPLFYWLVGARTLLAFGSGMFTATALATAAMIAGPGQRGQALQIVSTGQTLAAVFGAPAATWVAGHLSWRLDYAAIAVMATMACAALYLKLPKGMHGDTLTMADRIRVLGNPGVGPALVMMLLVMTATYPPLVFMGPVLRNAGISLELLPLLLLANGIGALTASRTAGRLADWLGNRPVLLASALLLVAMLSLVAAVPSLPAGLRMPALLQAFAVQGYIGWAFWIAHCSEIAHLAPSSVPVAISLDLTALNLGIAIAAGFGGLIIDAWGVNALCLAAIPLALAGLALLPMMPASPVSAAEAVPRVK